MKKLTLSSKARTLEMLAPHLLNARVLPVFRFSVQRYAGNKAALIDRIKQQFKSNLIVRSSSQNEDNASTSNAGGFDSVMNVDCNNAEALQAAIDRVVESYGDSETDGDEVFIQPMLENVEMAGVVFSADIDTLSDYYIINYDESGSTDSVTSGRSNDLQTFISFKSNTKFKDKRLKAIIVATQECEKIFNTEYLDIEFSYAKGELYILQVRSIVAGGKNDLSSIDLKESLNKIQLKIENLNNKHPNLLGDKTIFGVEREVRRMIHILIPVCYLEGYKSLVNQATNLPWPSSPKFVFTSNNFSSDEVFKLWVADKVESKIPYYIGQHGNNYGTLRSSCTSPAITTCDKFFSWGWSGVYPNQITVPAFIFKTIGQGYVDVNKQGGLIFIGASSLMAAGRLCQDQFYEHMLYQQQVLSFLDNLNVLIRSKTTIRLHSSYRNNKVLNEKLWADSHPDITMDYGYINIFKVIPKNRLTVYSYDSTGILENLSLNLPTVCFWYEGLDDLLLDAIPYYELLIDAKIVHLSPESAAEHIRKYWNNIDEWWGSESIQSVRSIFCKKYARKVDDPVHSLKELLLQD